MSATVSEARIKRAFATFDYNNRGHITHDELERILRALGFRGMSKQLVATFMRTTSTRKNPSEVTYGDCLRIIQSSGFDHIFEESFQVCQVLDKAESGRIVPEAMARAALSDGRFDAYIDPSDVDENSGSGTTSPGFGNTLRKSALSATPSATATAIPSPSKASGNKANNNTNTNAFGSSTTESHIDENELTQGGDRRRVSISTLALGIPVVDVDSTLTTEKVPLAPASAKRQKLFHQIHRFIHRTEDSANLAHNATSALTLESLRGGLSASGKHQTQKELDVEQDPALTFDEWRHVQATAEKANEAEIRRRRRHMPTDTRSLSGTFRGQSSSGINTPRGGVGGILSTSTRF